jgi:hypothetical protein
MTNFLRKGTKPLPDQSGNLTRISHLFMGVEKIAQKFWKEERYDGCVSRFSSSLSASPPFHPGRR